MNKLVLSMFLILICVDTSYAENPSDKTAKTPKSNEKDINKSNLIDANFNFAVKMYHLMKTENKNLFFSPYNIS